MINLNLIVTFLIKLFWEILDSFYNFIDLEPNVDIGKKAVVVTGCDSGFGYRLAIKLNELGFRVYATVPNATSVGALNLKNNVKHGNQLIITEVDLMSDKQIADFKEKVINDLAKHPDYPLWALVNNGDICEHMGVDWGTMDIYRRHMQINLFCMVDITRKFLPQIIANKGRIVNVSSMSGRVAFPFLAHYSMSKAALISFTDTLRRELLNHEVKVSSIEPIGYKTGIPDNVDTNMKRNWLSSPPEVRQMYGDDYAKKRINYYSAQTTPKWIFTNLDHVVDDIIDALISKRPKKHYKCSSNLFIKGIMLAWFNWTPDCLTDWICRFYDLALI